MNGLMTFTELSLETVGTELNPTPAHHPKVMGGTEGLTLNFSASEHRKKV